VPTTPWAVKVTLCPGQILVLVAVMLEGALILPEQLVDIYPKFLVETEPQLLEQQLPTFK
jgi:hypothetical protein